MRRETSTNTELLDASLIPGWIYCPETLAFLYVNEAAIKAYGYSREEFARMTLKDIRPEEDLQHLLNDINNGVRPDITRPHTSQWRHCNKNGDLFYVEMFSSYIEYNGSPARMVQAIDIDKKVKEQQETIALNALLREQKDNLDYVLASIKDVVWVAYADNFQLIYTNDACEHVHGYTAAEMIADKSIFFNSIHPEDMPEFMDSFRRTMETGSDEREFRIIHKDGSIRHLRGTCVLKKGINGARDLCCGLTIDITELKKEQKRTENILNSITDGFFVLDKDFRFTYINQAYKNMFKGAPGVLHNQTYWELFPNAVEQKFYTEYQRAIKEHIAVHFEEYATSLHRWVKVSAYPLGEGLAVYFTDINEEHELREALIKQERNMEALINNTDNLIWSVDKNLNLLSINRACCDYVHSLTDRWMQPGQPSAVHYFPTEMKERWLDNYSRALAGETFKTVEQHEGPEGEQQYWEASFYQIRDTGGNIIGVSCFCTNITEARSHTLRIEMQNERLKEIAHMQSHQVRGPVATIMGLQQLINISNPDDPINTEVLNGIQTACQALDSTIRSIDKRTYIA